MRPARPRPAGTPPTASCSTTLGRQTGLALHNARLAAELRERLDQIREQAESLAASRARIVAAEEAARRGIERDIHDGVQQELVALIARHRRWRATSSRRDPTLVDETLAELQGEAGQALDDLRELARGIHPSVLSDRGLVDAIEGRAARLPLGVTIECDPGCAAAASPRRSRAPSTSSSARGSPTRSSTRGAERVIVRLRRAATARSTVEVSDDGVGFDPARRRARRAARARGSRRRARRDAARRQRARRAARGSRPAADGDDRARV